jgi:plastocyanin
MPEDPAMTRRPPLWLVALAVPVVALIAVVATRAVKGPSDAGAAPTGAHAIVIKSFAFHPPKLTVAKGTKVTVTNDDGTTHTLSARDGSFDTGDLGAGRRATITLDRTGTFSYFCKIHNYMTGTVVVR